ncbi:Protein CL16A [Gryganskiella cystojenkinii]|nr:Protein CL16A [Gryganskiella cystojenkinii]
MFNLLWNKPKPDRFSLENLKALCEQLQQFSKDANEETIIGCLKELTQLLIWGDQHDPLLLEHFFEQNVHWHFLKILQSKQDGSLIVQVLQTLNIMFENVRSQESLYFLLSNNYVNQVIGVRYDFSNDEILAYYIYLLRTLSFKLSKDTIYFFFNEHLDDFPLYSEAIKFFNHEESMIRIAVRVITLNVYSVDDKQMQEFILDRTTTTYFSNLVWFIGNYGTTINDMLLNPGEGEFSRINYYLAEHMDCFYYVNDIIELEVPKINKILISHLLNRLLRPMYLDSILPQNGHKTGSNGSSSGGKSSSSVVFPQARAIHQNHPLTPVQPPSPGGGQLQQQHNPYKTSIFEYLSRIDNDRLVLPALTLIYLAGRNPGVMQDVLLGTDIYPQRLLKTRLLMGNLMSSLPPTKGGQNATPMSRERSSESILSNQSLGSNSTGAWLSSPGQGAQTSLSGSLFGAAGSATAARMRTRTESPLFETEEDDLESRETEELLASKATQGPSPPTSSTSMRASKTPLSSSLPSASAMSSAAMARNHSFDGEMPRQQKSKSQRRRGSKTPTILGPILPSSTSDESSKSRGSWKPRPIVQELKPVSTSKEDRELIDLYPSPEDYEGRISSELDSAIPPPLPPRPSPELPLEELETIHESEKEQTWPVVQNREELIDRLLDIVCGRPESGAHRFRIITIQMATELLIEFVSTKVGNKDKDQSSASHNSGSSGIDNQLGEARLDRLFQAETQLRERVQKGIRLLEKSKRREGSGSKQPLGLQTGRVERALNESNLGIDRQIVNIISEASVIYGPDRDLDKELDLDPDEELKAYFNLDPYYTDMSDERQAAEKTAKDLEETPPPSNSGFASNSGREGRRARMRTKIKVKMQGASTLAGEKSTADAVLPKPLAPPTKPALVLRLEAMVIRYIKWLHLLMQCRQLLCRKIAAPAVPASFIGSPLPPTVTTTSVSAKSGTTAANFGSPTISVNGVLTAKPIPMERRPSDLLGISNGAVASAHKGLQKALATTAMTTTTASTSDDPVVVNATKTAAVEGGPLSTTSSPSTTVNSTISSPSPSASSSTSSLTSMNTSPNANRVAVASGTLSPPSAVPITSTSGQEVSGARTLLTATAALEAAAHSATATQHQQDGFGIGSPFINEMMLNLHLDPLSASVSEAFRKSSARIKKSVVDPLAANPLFRTSSGNSAATSSLSVADSTNNNKGFYRPPSTKSATSSAGSSVVSLVKPGSSSVSGGGGGGGGEGTRPPMQRTLSSCSTSTSHSGVPAGTGSASVRSTGGGSVSHTRTSEDQTTFEDDLLGSRPLKHVEGSEEHGDGHDGEEEEFKSILDPGYPTYEADEDVQKILATLRLL